MVLSYDEGKAMKTIMTPIEMIAFHNKDKNQGIVESKKDGLMVISRIKSPEIYQMIDIAERITLRQIEETKSSFSP